jgi:phage recombination protein Bet
MGNEVVVSEAEKQQKALMQVVRNTVFKGATDEELVLFFHICQSNNVNPLDRLIHPSVYKDRDGNRTVVTVTSIDLMRSRSVATALDNGMDEPRYEGALKIHAEEGELEVPELCRVSVYKHGVERPYVGIARWKEFYPGEKRGHMWRKMPYIMLAKCAEAQARRLAYPKELGKLYEESEMQQATMMLAGMSNPAVTGKPDVTQPQEVESPTDDVRKTNKWISEKQEKLLYYECKKAKVDIDDLRAWVKLCLKKDHIYMVSWFKDEFNKILEHVKTKPTDFAGYAAKLAEATKPTESPASASDAPANADGDAGYKPTPKEEFEIKVSDLLEAAGKGQEALAAELKTFGYAALIQVKEADYDKILAHLQEVL